MKKLIAIALTLMLCLSVMSVAAFAAPEGINSLAVVGAGIPGVPEWKPEAPEGDMTEVSDSVYVKILDCPAGTSMNFKVAGNDKWDDTCNFGSATIELGKKADLTCAGDSGNMALALDKACKIKITVDLTALKDGGAATILVEETTEGGNTSGGNTTGGTTGGSTTTQEVVLSVKAPAAWTDVYVYAWDDSNTALLGAWPGSKATKQGDWFVGKIPADVKNLVVNNGAATAIQTKNLTLEGGKNAWVVVGDKADAEGKLDATVTYTAPAGGTTGGNTSGGQAADTNITGTQSAYRVTGDGALFGNWDAAFEKGRMVETEPGVYKVNFENVPAGTHQIKVTKDGKWDVSYGDNGQNYSFTVSQACTITVTFTMKGDQGVISVKGTGVVGTGDVSMFGVVALMILAATTTVVLVSNKKKFI